MPDERIELYESGKSLSQIAAMTNYSKSGVYYWLKANDVEMRPQGYTRENNNGDEPFEQEAS